MCCSASGYSKSEINGECANCGGPTIDGDAYYHCSYSPIDCEVCDSRYCDQSC